MGKKPRKCVSCGDKIYGKGASVFCCSDCKRHWKKVHVSLPMILRKTPVSCPDCGRLLVLRWGWIGQGQYGDHLVLSCQNDDCDVIMITGSKVVRDSTVRQRSDPKEVEYIISTLNLPRELYGSAEIVNYTPSWVTRSRFVSADETLTDRQEQHLLSHFTSDWRLTNLFERETVTLKTDPFLPLYTMNLARIMGYRRISKPAKQNRDRQQFPETFRSVHLMLKRFEGNARRINRRRPAIPEMWVVPSNDGLSQLPTLAKHGAPWRVLSVHPKHFVVEVRSKTGKPYPVTFSKQWLKTIPATNLLYLKR